MTELHAPDAQDSDVVALLERQHEQIRDLLDRVMGTTGTDRKEAFDALREMLARHETGEEMVLRPLTRRVDGGEDLAAGRMDEENEAKQVLAHLEQLHVDSDEFTTGFAEFRLSVLAHAEAEEQQEFPAVRAGIDAGKRGIALGVLWKAEQAAPTHPHPSAKTTTMNYIAGPFAAMLDRARDALARH
ncbi:MAG: hemerythrin domain-containing protein [Mycobacteriales bacterium]